MDTIDKINAILKERGMSGADLSRQIGLSTAVYSQWNRKKTKPSNKNIAKVAEVLNVPVSDLTGEVQKEKPIPVTEDGLDEVERQIMSYVRTMDSAQKDTLVAFLRTTVSRNQGMPTSVPELSGKAVP